MPSTRYNGHPHYAKMKVDLTAGARAAVVGNGNVAIDVARILLRYKALFLYSAL